MEYMELYKIKKVMSTYTTHTYNTYTHIKQYNTTMAKTNTTLTCEPEILEEAKSLNINLSETFREAIRAKIGFYKGDLSDINLSIVNQKIVLLQNRISNETVELNDLIAKKKNIEKVIQEKEEKELKLIEDRIKKEAECMVCHNTFNDKRKRFAMKGKPVCTSCYLNGSKEQRLIWDMVVV